MAVPAGAEIALYNNPNKVARYRILLGLKYAALLAPFSDSFAAPISPVQWAYSDNEGPPPVSGGSMLLQMLNGAPHMWAQTREICFPDDLDAAFEIEVIATFPVANPVYSQVITFGTIENTLGQDEEPFRISQHGSTRDDLIAAGDIGKLFYSTAAAFPSPVTNDLASHTYWLRYDPDAVDPLVIEVDSVEIYAGEGPRPYYVRFGMEVPPEAHTAAEELILLGGGTIEAPDFLTTISVQNISITPDVNEVYVMPGWTFENEGGDIDSALDGEQFDLDDERWVKIPKTNVVSWDTSDGMAQDNLSGEFTLELRIAHPEFPETYPNRFLGTKWAGHHMVLDTYIATDESGGTDGAWRRQFVGIIKRARIAGDTITITARDRLSDRLDEFIPRGFLSLDDAPTVKPGANSGNVRSNLTLAGPDVASLPASILTDLIWVTDGWAGGVLGAAAYQVRLFDHRPVALDGGGHSFLPLFQELCDIAGLEWWRKYRVTGAERYGQHMVAARSIGGTPGYTWRGLNASGGNSNIDYPPGLTIDEDEGQAPGQIIMRPDSSTVREVTLNTEYLPILGTFPSAGPYPVRARVHEESNAAITGFGLSTLVTLKDHNNVNVPGGVAYLRWRAEQLERVRFEWKTTGHDWMEPTDVVDFDDARTGQVPGEAVIIVNRALSWRADDPQIRATIHGIIADHVAAIRRTT